MLSSIPEQYREPAFMGGQLGEKIVLLRQYEDID